jgi:hypothetical protein
MSVLASSFFSLEPESSDAGQLAGTALKDAFRAAPLRAALVYSTMSHDQSALLQSLRATLGPDVPLIGCSVQGVAGDTQLTEDGYAMGVMGLGGEALAAAVAVEREFQMSSLEKGQVLARKLKTDLGREPNVVVVLYDPLCWADVEAFLSGMRRELSCPLVGGGAGQPFGPPVRTYQYWGEEVMSQGVVALALAGPFAAEIGLCHGTSPTGVSITVTKSRANHVLEIDDRPAIEKWREATGCAPSEVVTQQHLASWAIGIERRFVERGTEMVAPMIRGAFGFDAEGGVILQTAVPEGARAMFHHRTVEDVLEGTTAMGKDLAARLDGRRPWAVLGFECAARTYPFLGPANTLAEHRALRAAIAPHAPWLGMMAWGEIAPLGGQPAFHNYTFPVLVLTER